MVTRVFLQNNSSRRFGLRDPAGRGDTLLCDGVESAERKEIQRIAVLRAAEPIAQPCLLHNGSHVLLPRGDSRRTGEGDREVAPSVAPAVTWPVGPLEFTIHSQAVRRRRELHVTHVLQESTREPHLERDEFKILTYNTWLRPWFLPLGQSQRTRLIPQVLGGYDVVVLNEIFVNSLRAQLLAAMEEEYPYRTEILGGWSLPKPLGPGLKMTSSGVVVLSRWPIERSAQRSFRLYLGPMDSFSDKGVQYLQINKQGRRVHLFALHSHAAPEGFIQQLYGWFGRDVDQQFYEYRRQHWGVIREMMASLKLPGHEPVLIAGDLNTDRIGDPGQFDDMLRRLRAGCPETAGGHGFTFDPQTNPLADGDRRMWLDYVLYSREHLAPVACSQEVRLMRASQPWHTSLKRREFWDLSDHYGVVGRFRFPRMAVCRP